MRATVPSLLLAALLLAAPPWAHARMYQWVSSSSSVPQLSGQPPPWYRSEFGGPRVRVFENGNLVDDTAIALPASQRQALRADAFREAEDRRRADALRRLERAVRVEESRRAEEARIAQERRREEQAPAVTAPVIAEQAPSEPEPPAASDLPASDDAVAQLKAIIAEFDRRGGRRQSR